MFPDVIDSTAVAVTFSIACVGQAAERARLSMPMKKVLFNFVFSATVTIMCYKIVGLKVLQ